MGVPGFYGGYSGGLSGTAAQPVGSGPIDAYGNVVPNNQATYITRINHPGSYYGVPTQGIPVYAVNPNYQAPPSVTAPASTGATTTQQTTAPPHFQFTFDTIGSTIFRSIGHCRLPLRFIWVKGVNFSGTVTASPTITFAAALCAPIDPSEEGQVAIMYSGDNVIYNPDEGGVIAPEGLSSEDAAALTASLNGAIIYPGDEVQLPAPLIVADKGADVTNAFRGIRYIIFELFPTNVLSGGGGGISIVFQRTNTITPPSSSSDAAVEFAAGAG
jgi:hypothetical protein